MSLTDEFVKPGVFLQKWLPPILKDAVAKFIPNEGMKKFNEALIEVKCREIDDKIRKKLEKIVGNDAVAYDIIDGYLAKNHEFVSDFNTLSPGSNLIESKIDKFRDAYSSDERAQHANISTDEACSAYREILGIIYEESNKLLNSDIKNIQKYISSYGEATLEGIQELRNLILPLISIVLIPDYDSYSKAIKTSADLAYENSPSMRLLIRGVEEELLARVNTDAKYSSEGNEGKTATLLEFINEKMKHGGCLRLHLQGTGGMGKTVSILQTIQDLNNRGFCAMYVQLNELRKRSISDYIKERCINRQIQLFNDLQSNEFCAFAPESEDLNEKFSRTFIFLDGMNEVSSDDISDVVGSIKDFIEGNKANIIISSRDKLPIQFANGVLGPYNTFESIKIEPLTDEIIESFLKEHEVEVPKDEKLYKLLKTPLMLVLYAHTYAGLPIDYEREGTSLIKWREEATAGSIILNFMQRELYNNWRKLEIGEINLRYYSEKEAEFIAYFAAINYVLPMIAWRMTVNETFALTDKAIDTIYNEAIQELRVGLEKSACKSALKGLKSAFFTRANLDNIINNFLTKTTKLLAESSKDGDNEKQQSKERNVPKMYEFMHQNFRDCLAAVHCLNAVDLAQGKDPQAWAEAPFSKNVLDYIYQLDNQPDNQFDNESETRFEVLWRRTGDETEIPEGKRMPEDSFTMRNLISYYRYKQRISMGEGAEKDMSKLTFSNHDLRSVLLGGCKFKNNDKYASFKGAIIGENTLIPLGHTSHIRCVAITPDGRYAISGGEDNVLYKWDLETGECSLPFKGHTSWVSCVAITPDGNYAVSGSWDNTLIKWDLKTGKMVGEPFKWHTDEITCVAITPDGKYAVSGSRDNTLIKWDLQTGEQEGKPVKRHMSLVNCTAITPDGNYAVSGSYGTLIKWNLETGKQEGEPVIVHEANVTCVAITPDGNYAVSGSYYNTLIKWDLQTGKQVGEPFIGHMDWVRCVAITPDGNYAISENHGKTLTKWNLKTWQLVGEPFKGHTDWVRCVAITPDGNYAVSGSDDKTLIKWDLKTGKPVGEPFIGHTDWVRCVAITPDGNYAVSGSRDKTLIKWNLKTGEMDREPFIGHTDRIICVAITPDGKHAVSGSYDKTLIKWNLQTGKPVGEPRHTSSVSYAAITPNGNYVISRSDDGTIRIWDIVDDKHPCVGVLESIPGIDIIDIDFTNAEFNTARMHELVYMSGAKVERPESFKWVSQTD